jgi:hypothetical protein
MSINIMKGYSRMRFKGKGSGDMWGQVQNEWE